MGSQRIDSFDVSPRAREVIDWKNARKTQLRHEYLKQIHHPARQPMVMDDAVHRYAIMRLTHEYQARLTGRSVLTMVCGTFGLIALCTWLAKLKKDERENLYRTGQVSYADRKFKYA